MMIRTFLYRVACASPDHGALRRAGVKEFDSVHWFAVDARNETDAHACLLRMLSVPAEIGLHETYRPGALLPVVADRVIAY